MTLMLIVDHDHDMTMMAMTWRLMKKLSTFYTQLSISLPLCDMRTCHAILYPQHGLDFHDQTHFDNLNAFLLLYSCIPRP